MRTLRSSLLCGAIKKTPQRSEERRDLLSQLILGDNVQK